MTHICYGIYSILEISVINSETRKKPKILELFSIRDDNSRIHAGAIPVPSFMRKKKRPDNLRQNRIINYGNHFLRTKHTAIEKRIRRLKLRLEITSFASIPISSIVIIANVIVCVSAWQ